MCCELDFVIGEVVCVVLGGDEQWCVGIKGLRIDDIGVGGVFGNVQIVVEFFCFVCDINVILLDFGYSFGCLGRDVKDN